jgi:hypothetical protein
MSVPFEDSTRWYKKKLHLCWYATWVGWTVDVEKTHWLKDGGFLPLRHGWWFCSEIVDHPSDLLVLLLLDAFYEANRCCREDMDGTFSPASSCCHLAGTVSCAHGFTGNRHPMMTAAGPRLEADRLPPVRSAWASFCLWVEYETLNFFFIHSFSSWQSPEGHDGSAAGARWRAGTD